MKQIINRLDNFNRVEFWAATTIFVFLVFFHITHALAGNLTTGENTGANYTPFNYFFVRNLIEYVLLYLSFIFLNFYVVPKLLKKEDRALNIFLSYL
jgi:two-component system, LytTR family, sensor kinase